jgi:hypothetical protein
MNSSVVLGKNVGREKNYNWIRRIIKITMNDFEAEIRRARDAKRRKKRQEINDDFNSSQEYQREVDNNKE